MRTFLSALSVFTCTAALVGCGSERGTSDPAPDGLSPNVPAAPTQPAEIAAVYERLGNACGGGHVTRSMRVAESIETNNLWTAPEADPAALTASKRGANWGQLLAVAEVGFEAISEEMTVRSSEQAKRCDASRELLTPITRTAPSGVERRQFTNLLFYAADHAHAARFPAPGEAFPQPVDAPLRLTSYLDVATSSPGQAVGGGVLYKDVEHQHLPVHVSCEKPLRVVSEIQQRTRAAAEELAPEMCRPPLSRTDESEVFECLVERLAHVPENRCTFVVVGAPYTTLAGEKHKVSLGGKLETLPAQEGAPVGYRLTVDRFEFHPAQQ